MSGLRLSILTHALAILAARQSDAPRVEHKIVRVPDVDAPKVTFAPDHMRQRQSWQRRKKGRGA